MKTRIVLGAALAFACIPAAFAQDGGATLRVDRGNAMVSTGGEFSSAASGARVMPGNRVMLTEGSQATLVYPNGCTQSLSDAGVYGVPASCVAGSGVTGGGRAAATGTDWGSAGIIIGGSALIALGLDNMDQQPGPPISR